MLTGVLQGSVLGSLLFLIDIDDVSSLKLSENTVLNLYADDMLLVYRQLNGFVTRPGTCNFSPICASEPGVYFAVFTGLTSTIS